MSQELNLNELEAAARAYPANITRIVCALLDHIRAREAGKVPEGYRLVRAELRDEMIRMAAPRRCKIGSVCTDCTCAGSDSEANAPGMVADSAQAKPVAFWNPAIDHDSAAFSYGQGGGYDVPLYAAPLPRQMAATIKEPLTVAGMVADSAGGADKRDARDAERLDWLLWKLPGDAIRHCVGELSDTADRAEFRAAIDAMIWRTGSPDALRPTASPDDKLEDARREALDDAIASWSEVESCCNTPSYCSSVMRCTAKDAAPAPASPAALTTEEIERLWERETGFALDSHATIEEADILGFARAMLAASPASEQPGYFEALMEALRIERGSDKWHTAVMAHCDFRVRHGASPAMLTDAQILRIASESVGVDIDRLGYEHIKFARALLAASPADQVEDARDAVRMTPCKGMNCGCTDGVNHSAECQAEHAAAIAGGRFVK